MYKSIYYLSIGFQVQGLSNINTTQFKVKNGVWARTSIIFQIHIWFAPTLLIGLFVCLLIFLFFDASFHLGLLLSFLTLHVWHDNKNIMIWSVFSFFFFISLSKPISDRVFFVWFTWHDNALFLGMLASQIAFAYSQCESQTVSNIV